MGTPRHLCRLQGGLEMMMRSLARELADGDLSFQSTATTHSGDGDQGGVRAPLGQVGISVLYGSAKRGGGRPRSHAGMRTHQRKSSALASSLTRAEALNKAAKLAVVATLANLPVNLGTEPPPAGKRRLEAKLFCAPDAAIEGNPCHHLPVREMPARPARARPKCLRPARATRSQDVRSACTETARRPLGRGNAFAAGPEQYWLQPLPWQIAPRRMAHQFPLSSPMSSSRISSLAMIELSVTFKAVC